MRITHRLPIKDWYDNNFVNHLDYPHIAGYWHYIMGLLLRLLDPRAFYEVSVYESTPVTFAVKYGIRAAILMTSLIFYYPAVVAIVTFVLKKERTCHKLMVILLMLNMPMYAYIEHGNTQVNAPHLGLILWALYLAMNEYMCLSTACFTLSIGYKHFNGNYVLPLAMYMIANMWVSTKSKGISVLLLLGLHRRPYRERGRCWVDV